MVGKQVFKLMSVLVAVYTLTMNIASAESIDRASIEKQAALALQGFDPTTYFNLSGATQGKTAFQALYMGERYLFANAENQQKFANNPAQFLPQFGALCAHSLVMEKDVIADPSIYTIEEGKLYMFVSQEAKTEWMKNSNKNLIAATKHWEYKSEKRFEQIKAKKRWKNNNTVELFTF
ncbi:hypothetical protein KO519_02180 [Paraglaciecola agarilytica]|uniref:YHS domain-containing (seleno)protein n=1 Tax=Paraglaciecola chathamensis TaxID=368405 RepID=UPI001C08D007|nr:YHS domain-containing (seleno)protein [Paraglaciecola agarilytica]MBU3016513.1 hypothetical protein [Paraglaciecola agarilytica]